METYKKMVDDFTRQKISNLLPFKGGGISPKEYSEKLKVYGDNLKSLDEGLVEMGTKYWKDRKDFDKEKIQQLHIDAINSFTRVFKNG